MANNRIYWAVQGIGIAAQDDTSFTAVHGAQSLGITTTFSLDQTFELGQLAIYENVEDIPDVEVTIEKVLDNYPLVYHLATQGANTGTIAGRSAQKCNVALNIYGDVQDSASGTPVSQVHMSGMYVSSVSYTFPVDGSCTESVTLVGNNKVWRTVDTDFFDADFDNEDTPGKDVESSYVHRRQHVYFDSVADGTATLLPAEIEGISSSGTNDKTADVYGAHIQNITVSCDLGRDNMNELGRRGPYFRYVNYPVEVTCEIETYSLEGDGVDAIESSDANLTARQIYIVTNDGTNSTHRINLGSQNKLASVTYGGADAGGGNATTTYTFTTFNDMLVEHRQDPTVALQLSI